MKKNLKKFNKKSGISKSKSKSSADNLQIICQRTNNKNQICEDLLFTNLICKDLNKTFRTHVMNSTFKPYT